MIFTKEENLFIIKIFKENLLNFNIFDKNEVSNLFEKILKKIIKKDNITGLINAKVYSNDDYGLIIELEPILSLFDDIQLKIEFYLNSTFLVEIDDLDIMNYSLLYYYDNKFYNLYNKKTDGPVIYKNCNEIINNGIKVNLKGGGHYENANRLLSRKT